MKQLIS